MCRTIAACVAIRKRRLRRQLRIEAARRRGAEPEKVVRRRRLFGLL